MSLFSSLGCCVVFWYNLNKKFLDILFYFPYKYEEWKPTWWSQVWWLAKLVSYDITWKLPIGSAYFTESIKRGQIFNIHVQGYWHLYKKVVLNHHDHTFGYERDVLRPKFPQFHKLSCICAHSTVKLTYGRVHFIHGVDGLEVEQWIKASWQIKVNVSSKSQLCANEWKINYM